MRKSIDIKKKSLSLLQSDYNRITINYNQFPQQKKKKKNFRKRKEQKKEAKKKEMEKRRRKKGWKDFVRKEKEGGE